MTSLRSAQRAYDNESPTEPAHDYTEDMTEAEFRSWLRVYYDCARSAVQDEITDFINERKARELRELLS